MADLEQAVPGHRFVLQVINYPDLTRALSEAFLGESISEAYPDARHIANQETGIAAGAFLERCPYRSREILDESFWPGEPKSFSESVA